MRGLRRFGAGSGMAMGIGTERRRLWLGRWPMGEGIQGEEINLLELVSSFVSC